MTTILFLFTVKGVKNYYYLITFLANTPQYNGEILIPVDLY